MPWTSSDAKRFTKKASTKSQSQEWSKTANAVLDKTGDDSTAIKVANSQVKKSLPKLTKSPSKGNF